MELTVEHVFYLVKLLFLGLITTCSGKITVDLREELQKGTVIMSLRDRLSMPTDEYPHVTFRDVDQYLVFERSSGREIRASIPPPASPWIVVGESSGLLKQGAKVDREELCRNAVNCYIVVKIYRASPQPSVQDIKIIYFRINDVNDNTPTFPVPSVDLPVAETAKLNHEIDLDRWQAVDTDSGVNASISYSISPPSDYFDLHAFEDQNQNPHLRLVVVKQLDYEEEKVHRLTLQARDGGSPSHSSTMVVSVIVEDVNDNAPVFDHKKYIVNLREDTPLNQVIEVVHATDGDGGRQGNIRYFIREELEERNSLVPETIGVIRCPVIVNNHTGAVMLRDKLDFKLHHGYKVIIEAVDGDEARPLTGKTLLLLQVEDVNDNDPVISVSFIGNHKDETTGYAVEGERPGTFLAQVAAFDMDEGLNGKVTLSVETVYNGVESGFGNFTELGKFFVDDDGFLVTGVEFDRESQGSYDVIIRAWDKGVPPRSSTKAIKIIILDENEFPPQFEHPDIEVNVPENQEVGSQIALVKARDRDSSNGPSWRLSHPDLNIERSRNGDIVYGLMLAEIPDDGSVEKPVMIGTDSGKITLIRSLDYETRQTWNLVVTARDGGRPMALQSTCKLVINVENVNDNEPTFVAPSKDNTTVFASTLSGEKVFTVLKALDFGLNEKTKMRYSIRVLEKDGEEMRDLRQRNLFRLNSVSGELSLNPTSLFQGKCLGLYKTTISVSDSGIPPQTTSMTLYIDVIDRPVPLAPRSSIGGEDENLFIIIIGAAVGGGLILILIILVAVFCSRKRRSKSRDTENNDNACRSRNATPDDGQALTVKTLDGAQTSCNGSNERNNTCNTSSTRRTSVNASGEKPCQYCDSGDPSENQKFIQVKQSDFQSPSSKYKSWALESPPEEFSPTFPDVETPPDDGSCGFDRTAGLGNQCTEMCRIYGHSDSCWMPLEDSVSPLWERKADYRRKDSGCSVDTSSSNLSYYKMSRTDNHRGALPDVVKTRANTTSDGSSLMSSGLSNGSKSPKSPQQGLKTSVKVADSRGDVIAFTRQNSLLMNRSSRC